MDALLQLVVGTSSIVTAAAASAAARFTYDARRDSARALRLLEGQPPVEGDGVVARLQVVEERLDEHARALRERGLLGGAD